MAQGVPVKIPVRVYEYLKQKATKKETDMKIEAGRMFDHYMHLRIFEKKMKGKRAFIFK